MGPEPVAQGMEFTGNPNEVDSGSSDRNPPISTRERELQTPGVPPSIPPPDTTDPWVACSWLKNLESTFGYMKCIDEEKVELATYHLQDQAVTWWDMQKTIFGEQHVTWSMYREEFLNLKQGDRSVMEYNVEFSRLAEFCPHLVAQDYDQMHQFTQGLAAYIRLKMSGFPGSSYREVLDRALFIEMTQQQVNLEKSNNKQATQKKEKRGQSSQVTSGGSSPPQKARRTSNGGSRSSQRDRKNDFGGIMCFQCGSKKSYQK
ncbi:uncharacterized protein LOC122029146 [Zingiber officinale]|uniref:uncharacterized protein LOC122029146 n=1 Tax=Zingiber officinale TaxID=94328 RepID=UPI001C4B0CDF|nr:uncharacterized protein LOC122029146 [Zingiber officinale]